MNGHVQLSSEVLLKGSSEVLLKGSLAHMNVDGMSRIADELLHSLLL